MSQSLIVMELKGVETSLYAMAAKSRELMAAAELGLRKGMEQFKTEVIRDQMTGRRYADFGLNVKTGTLRRSWRIAPRAEGTDYIVKLANDSKYARIHQYGGTIKHPGGTPYWMRPEAGMWIFTPLSLGKLAAGGYGRLETRIKFTKPHDIRMPKRLHVMEEFQASGNEIIMRNIRGAVNATAQKAGSTTSGFHARQ